MMITEKNKFILEKSKDIYKKNNRSFTIYGDPQIIDLKGSIY